MPDAETDSGWRSGPTLARLFWFGVGLAPLAGLLLLVGGGAGLRVAGVLAVLAVVLIGLSITLRPDNSAIRFQFEETLLEEIDNLREEMREEIATANRVSHQSFGERVGALQQQVEALRAERASPPVAAVAAASAPPPPAQAPPAQVGRAQYPPPASMAPPQAVGAAPAAVPRQSAPPHSVPPPHSAAPPQSAPPPATGQARPMSAAPGRPGPEAAGWAPASSAPSGRAPVSGPAPNGRAGPDPGGRDRTTSRRPTRQPEDPPARRATSGRADVPGGVYRRTETVQVTRSTSYVDDPVRDRRDQNGYDHRDEEPRGWSAGSPAEDGDSWTDRKLRERYSGGGRRSRHDTDGDGSWSREGDRWSPVSAEPVSYEPVSGEPVSAEPRRRSSQWEDDAVGLRIGERWAAVSADERSREMRMGERRSARHSGDSGTEYRYEDRWASVRRDDPLEATDPLNGRYQQDGRHDARYRDDTNGRDLFGGLGNGPGRRDAAEPDYSRPALPAASSGPSWNDSWEEPVRSGRGHRYRDEETGGRSYHTGSQRRLDFELSDERWR